MAKPQVLELKDGDRAVLEKIVKKGLCRRGKQDGLSLLLLKADGESVNAIAEKVGGMPHHRVAMHLAWSHLLRGKMLGHARSSPW